jgi:MFS family permease
MRASHLAKLTKRIVFLDMSKASQKRDALSLCILETRTPLLLNPQLAIANSWPFSQGVMSGLVTLPSWVKTFPEIDTVKYSTSTHVSTIQGITVSSYNLGCFCGAVITIFLGDVLGRRKMILLGSSIMVIGAILQCSSFSLAQLIVGVWMSRIYSFEYKI